MPGRKLPALTLAISTPFPIVRSPTKDPPLPTLCVVLVLDAHLAAIATRRNIGGECIIAYQLGFRLGCVQPPPGIRWLRGTACSGNPIHQLSEPRVPPVPSWITHRRHPRPHETPQNCVSRTQRLGADLGNHPRFPVDESTGDTRKQRVRRLAQRVRGRCQAYSRLRRPGRWVTREVTWKDGVGKVDGEGGRAFP